MIETACRSNSARKTAYPLALLALLLASAGTARGATPEQVDNAITKAKAYIYSKINADGNWERSPAPPAVFANDQNPSNGQWGGLTAIATYALLAADEEPTEPRLAKAISFMEKTQCQGIYSLGFRTQVWHMVGAARPDIAKAMEADGSLLVNGCNGKGMYDYIAPRRGENWDHSASQYGVLGVWACELEGLEVSSEYFRKVDAGWRATQLADGSWDYGQRNHHQPSVAMTAAGVASLFITQMELGKLRMQGGCLPMAPDPNIDKGLKWISDNFNQVFEDTNYRQFYGLYGIERTGVASGRKYLGVTDWYKVGAQWLVDKQEADGHWGSEEWVSDTCYALLFLVRGRAPVIYQKLIYDGPWNQRPTDLSNLSAWIAREAEVNRSYLNWQIVSLDAPVDDLHDAPIMLISGDKELKFSDADEKKLKQFIEDGGMIVFNADCGAPSAGNPFTISAEKLGMKLFPDAGEFETLAPNDPVFKGTPFHQAPRVLGLSNGVRQLMVLIPQDDPDRFWQANSIKLRHDSFQLGKALLFYCIDPGNLAEKGRTYIVRPDPGITATRTLKVARIQYNNGGWDPEPGGWRRMAGVMHNRFQMDLDVQPVKLGSGLLDGFKVAVLTGVSKFTLNDAQWAEIKKFVDGGGTLLVDAAGGNPDFDAEAQADLIKTFPGAADALSLPLPQDHPLFTQIADKLAVHYRPFSRHLHPALRDGNPMLCAIPIGERLGVFYSNVDLSAGLVGEDRGGIDGYTPAVATDIVAHILLYVDSGGKPVPDTTPPVPAADTTVQATPAPVPAAEKHHHNRQ